MHRRSKLAITIAGFALCASASSSVFAQAPASPGEDTGLSVDVGGRKLKLGVDFSFAGVRDHSQIQTRGAERQIKPAFLNLSAVMDLDKHFSFLVVVNPVEDGIVPKPYNQLPTDRRTYFLPNQVTGEGASSDPNGLKDVDDYKYSGFDPIIQQGALRFAYLDVHNGTRKLGMLIGRFLVPQGWGLDEPVWFTAKDMTHIQRINAQADNGLNLYYAEPHARVDLALITGAGNRFHDYAYYDFTTPTEDKNSAIGAVITGKMHYSRFSFGGTYRYNLLNSLIDDATSVELSKHYDSALVGFGAFRPAPFLRVFGEVASYKWGLYKSSADHLPGPRNKTPVYKNGAYVGVDLMSPETRFGKWGLTATYEYLSRDDSLVAWAAANDLFGVTLGKHETGTIVKGLFQEKWLTAYGFVNFVSNPFPELSAIVPIAGPGAGNPVSNTKVGFGIRFRI
jgi:hypothetical protein